MSSSLLSKAAHPAPWGTLISFPPLPRHRAAVPQLQPQARLVTALWFWGRAEQLESITGSALPGTAAFGW